MAMDRKTSLLLIPLIIAIIAIIGLIAAIVYMKSDMDKLEEDNKAAAREVSSATTLRADILKQYQDLSEFVTGASDAVGTDLKTRYLTKRSNARLQQYLGEQPRDYSYLTELYDRLFEEREQVLQRAMSHEHEAKAFEEEKRIANETLVKVKEQKEIDIRNLQKTVRDKETEITTLQQQYKSMQARLQAQIDQARTEKQELEKQLNMEIAALRSEIAEKKRRIKELIKKPTSTLMWCDPDGEILTTDNRLGNCWIDLSRRDGLRVGSVFEVFRYIKGGRRKPKGRIEIKKVGNEVSQAAIIEMLDPEDDPIVKGDHIISPFFDKHETKSFVFAGDLTNPIYSEQEVIKMIEEMGGKVEHDVTVETDFLIVGKGAEDTEKYTRALDLGTTIMLEKELFKFLGK
jgi:NAD-dependent DNA ligase